MPYERPTPGVAPAPTPSRPTPKRSEPVPPPACPYCGASAKLLIDSSSVYCGHDYGPVWICRPCAAWVGTHTNSPRHVPLGRLANAELRAAKSAAHAVFDILWQRKLRRDHCSKQAARKAAYQWLAAELGIDVRVCHIGMFDVDQCMRVVSLCTPWSARAQRFDTDPWPNPAPEESITTQT